MPKHQFGEELNRLLKLTEHIIQISDYWRGKRAAAINRSRNTMNRACIVDCRASETQNRGGSELKSCHAGPLCPCHRRSDRTRSEQRQRRHEPGPAHDHPGMTHPRPDFYRYPSPLSPLDTSSEAVKLGDDAASGAAKDGDWRAFGQRRATSGRWVGQVTGGAGWTGAVDGTGAPIPERATAAGTNRQVVHSEDVQQAHSAPTSSSL